MDRPSENTNKASRWRYLFHNSLHTCGLIMILPFGTLCISVTAHTNCFSVLSPPVLSYGVEVGDGVTDSDR